MKFLEKPSVFRKEQVFGNPQSFKKARSF